ncbi:MAG: CapA family protein, partial [Bacteroidales bacterium]|nr:CapA family protein [Bacteroidales bacterium]
MRLMVACFVLLSALTLQAQDPVKLPVPTLDLWSTYNLTGFPDKAQVLDIIPEKLPLPPLTDSMLWSCLYLDELQEEGSLTIIGTGDIMLGTSYPSESYLPPTQDCSPILRPVHHVLQSGDLLFGNMEGVFCSEGG